MQVKLFEANDKLGGSCATTISDYTFDSGALYLTLPGLLDHVFEKLSLDRPALLPLRKITANQKTTLPDGTVVSIGEGFEVSIRNSHRDVTPLQLRPELNRLLRKWEPVLHLFVDDLLRHPFSWSRLLRAGWRHLPKLRGSVASELNELLSNEALQAALSGVLLYTGLPPRRPLWYPS